jgi:hypothetical protein
MDRIPEQTDFYVRAAQSDIPHSPTPRPTAQVTVDLLEKSEIAIFSSSDRSIQIP